MSNPLSPETFTVKKGILTFLLGIVLALSPYWAMPLQKALKYHWYTTSDGLFVLGITLIFALACRWILPSWLISVVESIGRLLKKGSLYFLLFFAGALVASLYLVNQNILNSFLSSADEHACYFLAECIRLGRLWVPTHALQEFFDVVHVGSRDGRWFSVYPLGWPLLWAMGLQLNIVDWLNPILTTLALLIFYKVAERLFSKSVAWLGLFLTLLGPFFFFTSASYFSHGTCLLTIAIFLYAFVRWRAAITPNQAFWWASLTAVAVGYGLMTRYLTMAAVSAPFLIYHFYPILRFRKPWGKAEKACVIILSLFVLSVFVQNFLVTGNPLKAPNKYDKSWERLGFDDGYTPITALNYVIARLFYLMDWFAPMIVILFLVSLFSKREDAAIQRLFRYGLLYIAAAYFFYFSWGGNQFGPRYYYEGLPFLSFVTAAYVHKLWTERGVKCQKFIIGVMIASVIAGGYFFQKHAAFYSEASAQRKDLYRLSEETLQEPAIVFIKGFLGHKLVMGQEDAVRNSPLLNQKILYAHDRGDENQKLMNYYPKRKYYRGTYDREEKRGKLEAIV